MICSLDFYRSEQSLNNDMMKYRLKSKYLQKRLDEISCGDFTERLQESVSKVAPCVVVTFGAYPGEGKHCRFMASFEHKEIEEIPALYDPTAWNEWPNAEPPHNVLMRVEIFPKEGYLSDRMIPLSDNAYAHRILTADRWVGWWQLTEDMKLDTKRIERLRYKPWEFEE